MDVEISDKLLRRAIGIALEELSAGMTKGHRVATITGLRPSGLPVLIRGVSVALVPEENERPNGMRLASIDGRRL